MSIRSLWDTLSNTPSFRPTAINIPAERVDIGARLNVPFKKDQEYFLVRINEMYLSYKRKWFSTYDPVVYVLSEFDYDGEIFQVPFIVGPSMIGGKLEKIPNQGMLYKNTTVAGLHPYRGGTFGLSIVLCRMRQENYLRKLLSLIENTSGTYASTFATSVSSYAKVAHVVLDSVDELLGSEDVEPLIGQRNEYNTSVDNNFSSGFFALVNLDEADVDKSKFYVKNNTLCYGNSLNEAEPYRQDDYVLYSVMSTKSRDDYDKFSFSKEFKAVKKGLENIKGKLSQDVRDMYNNEFIGVKNMVRNSPDLIESQRLEIIVDYTSKMQALLDDRNYLSKTPDDNETEAQPVDEWKTKMDKLVNESLKF